ncbi:MAG: helicase-related protein [Erysipelothrix sp.]
MHQRLEEESSYYVNDTLVAQMPFELSPQQKKISEQIIEIIQHESVLVDAVCGAGKTEICIPLVTWCLKRGVRIGWTIPRREVVLELGSRLQSYYPKVKIAIVCGGSLEKLQGDLVVCTTHQLHRYYDYFDILIVDEPDAFPYKDNDYLEQILTRSVRGNCVYLSATESMPEIKTLKLPVRPTGRHLPVPQVRCTGLLLLKLLEIIFLWRDEMVLIFVPTRKIAKRLSKVIHAPYITSHTEDKKEKIDSFRKDKKCLITTTVLERGVTFVDCFVVVYQANHQVFTDASLIQIAGRVDRGKSTKGECIFLCTMKNQSIICCVNRINQANTDAEYVLRCDIKI